MEYLPLKADGSVSWDPSPSDVTQQYAIGTVATDWSVTQLQASNSAFKLVHDAACTSPPTLALQLNTSIDGSLTIDAPLYLQGVDVLASIQALQSATPSAAHSSGGCSLPWTKSCASPVVVDKQAVSSSLTSYKGGFATSTHAYYVPYRNGVVGVANVARILLSDFSTSGVEHFNLASVSSSLVGFVGGFATSTHAYYAPNVYNSGVPHGNVVRISHSLSPTSRPAAWSTLTWPH
jgi:hypothetical protein